MSKRKIIILVLAVILIGFSAYSYFFFEKKDLNNNTGNDNREGTLENLFPSSGDAENEKQNEGGVSREESQLPQEGSENREEIFGQEIEAPKQLTINPISGYTIVSTTSVRYVETSTGHIYEVDFSGENYNRLSNTTILKTEESYWSPKGDKVIIRYLNGVNDSMILKNYSAVLPKSASSTELTGSFFNDFKEIAVSSSEESVALLQKNSAKYDLILTSFENTKRKLLASFPIGQFNISWAGKNTLSLLTKPTRGIQGIFYGLDIKTGSLRKIVEGNSGLTAKLSPLNNFVFYSETDKTGKVIGYFYDVKKNQRLILGTNTFADKCIWSNKTEGIIYCAVPKEYSSGVYPDDWYKGVKSTEDKLWLVDAQTGEVQILSENMGGNIDAVDLKFTSDESYFFYTNKKDGTLWTVKIR